MSEVEWETALEAVTLARQTEVCSFLELAVKQLKDMGWGVGAIQEEVWGLYHGVGTKSQT